MSLEYYLKVQCLRVLMSSLYTVENVRIWLRVHLWILKNKIDKPIIYFRYKKMHIDSLNNVEFKRGHNSVKIHVRIMRLEHN
jgi:hypothetical protein